MIGCACRAAAHHMVLEQALEARRSAVELPEEVLGQIKVKVKKLERFDWKPRLHSRAWPLPRGRACAP